MIMWAKSFQLWLLSSSLLREMRTWCRESSLQAELPNQRYECMDARMKLQKECMGSQ